MLRTPNVNQNCHEQDDADDDRGDDDDDDASGPPTVGSNIKQRKQTMRILLLLFALKISRTPIELATSLLFTNLYRHGVACHSKKNKPNSGQAYGEQHNRHLLDVQCCQLRL